MKKIFHFLFFTLIIFTLSNCKKETMKDKDAQLIGIDYRKCASPFCGGYWIEIEQDTLRFLDFPSDSDVGELDVNTVFPIPVEVTWKWPTDETLKMAEDLIMVEKISTK